MHKTPRLWFDVGNGRYTTNDFSNIIASQLWFDVGNGRYTTVRFLIDAPDGLWFDVGNGRYTTAKAAWSISFGCGLM